MLSRQLRWSQCGLLPLRRPLPRDFYAETYGSQRWDVRSSGLNKATIEPSEVPVMTLKGLLVPGIGVLNETR